MSSFKFCRLLEELKKTDVTLTENAMSVFTFLKELHVDKKDSVFFETCRNHYENIVKYSNFWDKIETPNEKSTPEEIAAIFKTMNAYLADEAENEAFKKRAESCAWISIHFTQILELFKQLPDSPEKNDIVSTKLITPVQRLPRLTLFSKEWLKLSPDDLEIQSINRKFLRVASTLNQLLKVTEHEALNQKANSSIFDKLFGIVHLSLIDEKLIEDSIGNSLEFSKIAVDPLQRSLIDEAIKVSADATFYANLTQFLANIKQNKKHQKLNPVLDEFIAFIDNQNAPDDPTIPKYDPPMLTDSMIIQGANLNVDIAVDQESNAQHMPLFKNQNIYFEPTIQNNNPPVRTNKVIIQDAILNEQVPIVPESIDVVNDPISVYPSYHIDKSLVHINQVIIQDENFNSILNNNVQVPQESKAEMLNQVIELKSPENTSSNNANEGKKKYPRIIVRVDDSSDEEADNNVVIDDILPENQINQEPENDGVVENKKRKNILLVKENEDRAEGEWIFYVAYPFLILVSGAVGLALSATLGPIGMIAGTVIGVGFGFAFSGLIDVIRTRDPMLFSILFATGATITGAGLGALLGSLFFPGVGTIMGAIIGAAIGTGIGAGLGLSVAGILAIFNKYEFGGTLLLATGSAGVGAGIGAILGTIIPLPGIGTAIGAGIGAAVGFGVVAIPALFTALCIKIGQWTKPIDFPFGDPLAEPGDINKSPNVMKEGLGEAVAQSKEENRQPLPHVDVFKKDEAPKDLSETKSTTSTTSTSTVQSL
jgi:hypothetical protein